MSDAQPQRLYRIIQGEQPAEDDFVSKQGLGIPCLIDDPKIQRRWTGLSLFGSEKSGSARRAAWSPRAIATHGPSHSCVHALKAAGRPRHWSWP